MPFDILKNFILQSIADFGWWNAFLLSSTPGKPCLVLKALFVHWMQTLLNCIVNEPFPLDNHTCLKTGTISMYFFQSMCCNSDYANVIQLFLFSLSTSKISVVYIWGLLHGQEFCHSSYVSVNLYYFRQ